MALNLKIHLDEAGYPSQTSKIKVPKSWSTKEVKDVIGLFAGAYNKKNPENIIDIEGVHFALEDGTKFYSNDTVEAALEDHQDYYIKFGTHLRPVVEKKEHDPSLLRCRNYGCNQYFREEENYEGACQHHTAPPIFHDTMKCWSCCKDRKAYDFESFQLITGCATGMHSAVPPAVTIAVSPNAPRDAGEPAAAPVKSISDFNSANPSAVSASSSAVKTISTRKSTRQADGTARCQRKGCQKTFVVAENARDACTYHAGQPVFHDAVKFWSCCPDIKCYDFDEFLAVKGCAAGWHDDGEIDLTL
jgi:hypothetical protein